LFGISTKPKPRLSPENLSLMIDAIWAALPFRLGQGID
jgi:hypothetical protein